MSYEDILRQDLQEKHARRDKVGDHVEKLSERCERIKVREQEVEANWAITGLFELCYRYYLKKKFENCNKELFFYKLECDALDTMCEKLEQKIITIDNKKTEALISDACAYMFGASVLKEASSTQQTREDATEEQASEESSSAQEVRVGALGE